MTWLRYSPRQLVWRSVLASPFGIALIITFALGPTTINQYESFGWLLAVSFVGAGLMLTLPTVLLIPLGVISFLVFPPMSALAFSFAPHWAQPAAVFVFYGSMLTSLGAATSAAVTMVRRRRPKKPPRLAATAAAMLMVLGLLSACGTGAAKLANASPSIVQASNIGPVINTSHRDAEPSFTADGRTMYFNCNDFEICVTTLNGAWEQGHWTTPRLLSAPINSSYAQVEPVINPAGDKLYISSDSVVP